VRCKRASVDGIDKASQRIKDKDIIKITRQCIRAGVERINKASQIIKDKDIASSDQLVGAHG
jgi:hypothetical protein